jgi:hypothetical protein
MLQLGWTEQDEGGGTVEELSSGASANANTPDASKVCLSCLSAPTHTLPHPPDHPISLSVMENNWLQFRLIIFYTDLYNNIADTRVWCISGSGF